RRGGENPRTPHLGNRPDRPWLRLHRNREPAVAAKESFAATAARVLLVCEIHGLSAVAKLLRRSAAKTQGFVKIANSPPARKEFFRNLLFRQTSARSNSSDS